ncbi:hypothetical protein ACQY0O_001507 [Thecaphora frezii]
MASHRPPHVDTLESSSDPRWHIPTHSQQHPSDTSYHPDDSALHASAESLGSLESSSLPLGLASQPYRIVASRAGQYKVVAAPDSASTSTSTLPPSAQWIPKASATPEMVHSWRAARPQRDELRQQSRRQAERKRKRSSASSSESEEDLQALQPGASRRPTTKRTAKANVTDDAEHEVYVDVPYASQQGRFVPYLSMTQPSHQGDPAASQGVGIAGKEGGERGGGYGGGDENGGRSGSAAPLASPSQTSAAIPSSLEAPAQPPQPAATEHAAGRTVELHPLRHLPPEAFVPYLDDDTGIEVDAAGRPRTDARAADHAIKDLDATDEDEPIPTQDRSSPVDQFSQSASPSMRGQRVRSPSPVYRPDQVPRIGSWIVPRPPMRQRSQPLHTTHAAAMADDDDRTDDDRPSGSDGTDDDEGLYEGEKPIALTQQLDSDEDVEFADGEDRLPKLLQELERRRANARAIATQSIGGARTPPMASQPSASWTQQDPMDADATTAATQEAGGARDEPRESTPPPRPAAAVEGGGMQQRSSERLPLPSQPIASQPPLPPPTDEPSQSADGASNTTEETQQGHPSQPPPAQQQQQRESDQMLAPPTPTPSQSQHAPTTTAAAATAAAASDGTTSGAPASSLQPSDTSVSTLSSSQGWCLLPRREICELVQRSSYVPTFLKDEVEKYVLRSKRAAASQRTASSNSQPSQSQDDSETQEDGFLRTKKVWCFDLLRGRMGMWEGSEGVKRITQQQQQQQGNASTTGGWAGARTVVLLLDTEEVTFDVQEIEETLAGILREDTRFGAGFDANGQAWAANLAGTGCVPAPAPTPAPAPETAEELLTLRAKIAQLETEHSRLTSALESTTADLTFVRSLYDTASSSATLLRTQSDAQAAEIRCLESKLAEGLETVKGLFRERCSWKDRRIGELEREVERRRAVCERTEEVRWKAALWDQQREGTPQLATGIEASSEMETQDDS